MSCLFCKYPVAKYRYAKYCSSECQHKYEWMLRRNRIIKTGNAKTHTLGRKYLLEKYGHRCKLCKRTKWNGEPIPLVLDHINGKAHDWSIKNLRLICHNCDAQTDTYKGRNRGNGRASRRERYHQGKSY